MEQKNILKRVSAFYDGKSEKSGQWHIDLLNRMAQATPKREAVISDELLTLLKEYLAFRHLFRSIYTHELKWEPMHDLVLGLEKSLALLEKEIQIFCASTANKQG